MRTFGGIFNGMIKGLKDKNIGVLMGGVSEEREISIKTGNAVLNALRQKGYNATPIDAGKDLPKRLLREAIDVAFIALHGRTGEDGCVQGMLEVMGIPYTGSGVRASSIAMEKAFSKAFLGLHGIKCPEGVVVKSAHAPVRLKPPFFVKPSSQGSAIGVSVVKKRGDLKQAIKKALRHGGPAIVEEYIKGRELTVAVLFGKALPAIEIRPVSGLYDYKAKYTKGLTEFLCPAPTGGAIEKRVREIALSAYNALGCAGAARVDIMLDAKAAPYVLEVNTIPGLTELSLFPMAAKAGGIDYPELVETMLKGASLCKDQK